MQYIIFNVTRSTEIYTLYLHDALPIWLRPDCCSQASWCGSKCWRAATGMPNSVQMASAAPGSRLTRSLDRPGAPTSEEHTSELQSRQYLVCRLLLEKQNYIGIPRHVSS